MKTYTTKKDYYAIINSFTEEEIKNKYGRLEIMTEEEYWNYIHPIRERKVKKR